MFVFFPLLTPPSWWSSIIITSREIWARLVVGNVERQVFFGEARILFFNKIWKISIRYSVLRRTQTSSIKKNYCKAKTQFNQTTSEPFRRYEISIEDAQLCSLLRKEDRIEKRKKTFTQHTNFFWCSITNDIAPRISSLGKSVKHIKKSVDNDDIDDNGMEKRGKGRKKFILWFSTTLCVYIHNNTRIIIQLLVWEEFVCVPTAWLTTVHRTFRWKWKM